jgi:hypothetical protein
VIVLTQTKKPDEYNSILCSKVAEKLQSVYDQRACMDGKDVDNIWGFGEAPVPFLYCGLMANLSVANLNRTIGAQVFFVPVNKAVDPKRLTQ